MSDDKKRKRDTEGNGRPAKKIATDSTPTGNVRVSIVAGNGELAPVVASTPGFSVPSNVSFKPYKKVKKSRDVLPPSTRHAQPYEMILQSDAHPQLDYVAREEQDGPEQGLLKHYIAVYDPEAGELRIKEAKRLVVRSTLRRETAEVQQAIEEKLKNEEKESYASQRYDLGMQFGNRKSRKAIEEMMANQLRSSGADVPDDPAEAIKKDPALLAQLEAMAPISADMPTREGLQAAADEAKPRPKHNPDATTPSEVYTLKSLVGEDLLPAIQVTDWIDSVKAGEDVKVSSRFVSRRLVALAKDRDGIVRLRALRYLYALMDFRNALAPSKRGDRFTMPKRADLQKKMDSSTSSTLLGGIVRHFAPLGSNLSKWHYDYLMTHICALSLLVDVYDTDLYELREDLKMQQKELETYFKEVGAKVTAPHEADKKRLRITSKAEEAQHKFARLKLPLEFPRQRIIKQKRR